MQSDNMYMQNKVSKYLSQSAPINDQPWLTVFLTTVIVILILIFFQPFQFNLDTFGQFKVLLLFALVVIAGTSVVFILFPKIFKRFYDPDKWTVGKTLLTYVILFVLVGLGVTSLNYFVFIKHLPENYLPIFLTDMLATLTIGMVPLSIITFIVHNRALKRNLQAAKEMNQALSERIRRDTAATGFITLAGSTKESVTAKPEDILYIEATGNYVNVHYKQKGKLTYRLLRTTIRQIEETLQYQPTFVRCHRTYIVNTDKICNVTGNAQGYKLSLYDTSEEIPVSRTYLKSIKDILR